MKAKRKKVEPKKDEAAKKPVEVVIDFDGLADRLKRVTIPNATESDLFWSADSRKLALTATIDGQRGTYAIEPPEDLKPMRLTATTGRNARWLDRPVVNLGFSGTGRMDTGAVDLPAVTDAAAFVVDCLPNTNPNRVRKRAVPFLRALRQARPEVPIVLVEDRRNSNSRIHPSRSGHHTINTAAITR